MKRLIIILFCAFFSINAFSQQTIHLTEGLYAAYSPPQNYGQLKKTASSTSSCPCGLDDVCHNQNTTSLDIYSTDGFGNETLVSRGEVLNRQGGYLWSGFIIGAGVPYMVLKDPGSIYYANFYIGSLTASQYLSVLDESGDICLHKTKYMITVNDGSGAITDMGVGTFNVRDALGFSYINITEHAGFGLINLRSNTGFYAKVQTQLLTHNVIMLLDKNNGTIPAFVHGLGNPNGVITGDIGQLYINDAGSGTIDSTLYVKESGMATTTGWVGK